MPINFQNALPLLGALAGGIRLVGLILLVIFVRQVKFCRFINIKKSHLHALMGFEKVGNCVIGMNFLQPISINICHVICK